MESECILTDVRPAKGRRRRVIFRNASIVALGALLLGGAWYELRESRLQARYFSQLARDVNWRVEPGQSSDLWLPHSGPYDVRLGYSQMKEFLPRLVKAGYPVAAQARQSDGFRNLTGRGYYPIYREKSQAGLTLLDRNGATLYSSRYPERQYKDFDAIPPILVESLLAIENRDLLDPDHPMQNPAISWGRLGRVAASQTLRGFGGGGGGGRAGASTLATQIEKFRHTPGGRTRDADDKFRQMMSASVRAYLDGEETLASRKRIVIDYLNSVPLGGVAGYGEVNGFGDGLWAWYGEDFASVNRVLTDPKADPADRARVFKEALSLIVAQRRPSGLLGDGAGRLNSLTDSYLRLLARDGVVQPELRDAALKVQLTAVRPSREPDPVSFVERKAVNDVRGTLGDMLSVSDLYALDRFDLEARTTLDGPAQAAVTRFLGRLADPQYLTCAGFRETRLLDRGDPQAVNYSFTLYESTPLGNQLRVQADNLDQPLDINAGTKLDLGSSAKFRTLISYLEIVAELHRHYSGLDAEALAKVQRAPTDRLTNWAIEYLSKAPERDLTAMLEAAMERRYSANPHETFFTGGGSHRFDNFKHEDDGKVPTLGEALEQSVNLVFVRLMRDVVHYLAYESDDAPARALREGDENARMEFLKRFAEREGIGFLRTFWHKYKDVEPAERLGVLADSVPARTSPLAAAYLSVQPDSDFQSFVAFMRQRLGDKAGTDAGLRKLYDMHAARHFTLSDQGYLARVHPLEIWLVRYLRQHPEASLQEVVTASPEERREASRWLFSNRMRHAQQVRIDIIVEVTAFERLAERWRRLGYPFEHLVPSLATSIGSSADRPAALAELMGVVVNDGVRRPAVRIDQLRFAAATPFETLLKRQAEAGEKVLPAEVAQVARRALLRVVDNGTARRVKGTYHDRDDSPLLVGGKTGTGDHRFQVVDAGGNVRSSRVMNRAATFAFYIGDRFYGVVTAFVPGAKAAGYDFTSALPVQILKELEPALRGLIDGQPATITHCDG